MHRIFLFFCLIGLANALPFNYEFQSSRNNQNSDLVENIGAEIHSLEVDDSSYIDEIPNTLTGGSINVSLWQLMPQRQNGDAPVRLSLDSEEEMWKSPLWVSDEEEEWEVLPKNPQPPPKYLKLIVIISSVALLSTILIIVSCVLLDDPNKDEDACDDDYYEEYPEEKKLEATS